MTYPNSFYKKIIIFSLKIIAKEFGFLVKKPYLCSGKAVHRHP